MTRRPLVLQLHKTEGGQTEFAEFLHLSKRRFTDFGILTLLLVLKICCSINVVVLTDLFVGILSS